MTRGVRNSHLSNYSHARSCKFLSNLVTLPRAKENWNDRTKSNTFQRDATYSPSGDSDFIPRPDLIKPDANIDLFFLLNNEVQYVQPVQDPWFKATKRTVFADGANGPNGGLQYDSFYSTSQPVSVVGCASRFQFCNPMLSPSSSNFCTPLRDITTVADPKNQKNLGFTPQQNEVLFRIWHAFVNNWFSNVVNDSGNKALLASGTSYGGLGEGLPANQWIRELDHFTG